MAVAYLQDNANYVADRVFANVPVQHQTNVYFVWSKDDFFRDEAQQRADATESAGTGVNLTTQTYSAKVYALHQDIGAQVRSNADPAVDVDVMATRQLMQKMMIRRDRIFMSKYVTTGVWGTDITGSATPSGATQTYFWDDDANGDPFTDIAIGQTTVLQNTGFEPNVLLLSWPVYQALRKNPLVIDRIKYTSPAFAGKITPQLLAEAFDIEQVVVSKAVYNSAAENVAGVYSFVMGKSALLVYRAPAPGLMIPSAGYTFSWTNLIAQGNMGVAIYQIPMPWRGISTVRTEAEMAFDMQVVGSTLGYFFSNITSA